MTASDFVANLRSQGVQFWAEAGSLRYKAPIGILSPVLREELQKKKNDILAILKGEAPPPRPTSIGKGCNTATPPTVDSVGMCQRL